MEQMAWLILRRPYRCIKCDRVQLGSVFLDFHLGGARKPKRKVARDHKDISKLKCPECGSAVRRSRRKGIEKLIFFARAYRCHECEARFRTYKLI